MSRLVSTAVAAIHKMFSLKESYGESKGGSGLIDVPPAAVAVTDPLLEALAKLVPRTPNQSTIRYTLPAPCSDALSVSVNVPVSVPSDIFLAKSKDAALPALPEPTQPVGQLPKTVPSVATTANIRSPACKFVG